MAADHKYSIAWRDANKNNSYLRLITYSLKRRTFEQTTEMPRLFWYNTFGIIEKNLIPDKNYKTIDDYFESECSDITYSRLSKHWIMLRDRLLSG